MRKRRLLDDRQCRVFLRAMREFGYPSLTFDTVRRIANEVAVGTHSDADVIAALLVRSLDETEEKL